MSTRSQSQHHTECETIRWVGRKRQGRDVTGWRRSWWWFGADDAMIAHITAKNYIDLLKPKHCPKTHFLLQKYTLRSNYKTRKGAILYRININWTDTNLAAHNECLRHAWHVFGHPWAPCGVPVLMRTFSVHHHTHTRRALLLKQNNKKKWHRFVNNLNTAKLRHTLHSKLTLLHSNNKTRKGAIFNRIFINRTNKLKRLLLDASQN